MNTLYIHTYNKKCFLFLLLSCMQRMKEAGLMRVSLSLFRWNCISMSPVCWRLGYPQIGVQKSTQTFCKIFFLSISWITDWFFHINQSVLEMEKILLAMQFLFVKSLCLMKPKLCWKNRLNNLNRGVPMTRKKVANISLWCFFLQKDVLSNIVKMERTLSGQTKRPRKSNGVKAFYRTLSGQTKRPRKSDGVKAF